MMCICLIWTRRPFWRARPHSLSRNGIFLTRPRLGTIRRTLGDFSTGASSFAAAAPNRDGSHGLIYGGLFRNGSTPEFVQQNKRSLPDFILYRLLLPRLFNPQRAVSRLPRPAPEPSSRLLNARILKKSSSRQPDGHVRN